MEKNKNTERIEEYNKTLESFKKYNTCWRSDLVESRYQIGNYTIARLTYLDDIYNHAYVEENHTYIVDKNGVPFKLFETQAGNANNNSSTAEEIKNNETLLSKVVDAVIFIDYSKKLPYSVKFKNLGQKLEKELNECLETGDFSKLSLDKFINKQSIDNMRNKFTKHLNEYEQSSYNFATSARSYKTRDEMYGKSEDLSK